MILQMISWFNVLYLTLQNCSLNIYKVIKIYKGVLYNALSNTKKHESYKVCLVWLHWKLILWKGLSWTHYSKLYFALSETKAWIL